MNTTENQMLIIFGASGDLTARKLVPSLFNLFKGKHLPKNFVILGVSRSDLSDGDFRKKVITESEFLKGEDQEQIARLADCVFYQDLGKTYDTDYAQLNYRIGDLNRKFGTDNNYIFYLSTLPII